MRQAPNHSERLRRAAAGDRSALAAPWRRHRARIGRTRLDLRQRRRPDPSDILQEASVAPAAYGRHRPMPTGLRLRRVACQRPARVHLYHLGAAPRDAEREVALDRGVPSRDTSGSLADYLLGWPTGASRPSAPGGKPRSRPSSTGWSRRTVRARRRGTSRPRLTASRPGSSACPRRPPTTATSLPRGDRAIS